MLDYWIDQLPSRLMLDRGVAPGNGCLYFWIQILGSHFSRRKKMGSSGCLK